MVAIGYNTILWRIKKILKSNCGIEFWHSIYTIRISILKRTTNRLIKYNILNNPSINYNNKINNILKIQNLEQHFKKRLLTLVFQYNIFIPTNHDYRKKKC